MQIHNTLTPFLRLWSTNRWIVCLQTSIATFVVGAIINGLWLVRRARHKVQLQRAEDELHPLLKDHTTFRSYKTKYAVYPSIRTFYRQHSHKAKHQDIDELPLLVFIHGLGGVLPQFAPLMHSLANIAPCFGIELAGHGRSAFAPKDYEAYTIEANVALWKTAIEKICEEHSHHSVVLIGHSMGCSISTLLASTTSTTPTLSVTVAGVVSICPRAHQITDKDMRNAKRLARMPNFVINILRAFDRRGGVNSTSVRRVVGDSNELDLKHLQLEWNRQYRTSVLKRITLGFLPGKSTDGSLQGGWPSESVWSGIHVPLLLVTGESDKLTPPQEMNQIVRYVTKESLEFWKDQSQSKNDDPLIAAINGLTPTTITWTRDREKKNECVIQAITIPAPAAHAVLYAHTTYRIVSALIESFLATYVSPKLDFGYQLRLMTTSGKWDVKNLKKWKAVLPVSGPINTRSEAGGSPNGLFRALKTMREQDDEHNPTMFLEKWADKVYAIIDISHDVPVYNTKTLEQGGVEYHKFPTVSKVPPTPVEVQDFCSLIDKLIAECKAKQSKEKGYEHIQKAMAVHCHYGYNRTGFFLCSYLITRCNYSIQEAIDEFARAKPPGIKHEYFIDMLWLRFAGRPQKPSKDGAVDWTEIEDDR